MPETRESKPSDSQVGGCRDKVLLVGAAVLVCVVEVAAFWIADVYHINPVWVFFLLNSMYIVYLADCCLP